MDKPWLMDEAEIDKIEYRMRRWSDRREVTLAVCRAQHLKTIRWLKSQGMLMGSLKLSLDDLFAQARKDVGDG